MIRAICFDFFGVICTDDYWNFVGRDNQKYPLFRDIKNQVNLGQIEWPQFIQRWAKIMDKSVEEVNKLYLTERLDPQVIDFMHRLPKQYKKALITNASQNFIDGILDRGHIRQLFDEIVVSSLVGYMKPDPRIYSYALEKLGVEPAEAVMIDDSPDNIKSATDLGMQGILYQGFDKFVTAINGLMTDSDQ
jgi:epoxide hydrolase-like predicted phosphatase